MDNSKKTEQPTSKRIKEVKERGEIFRSLELNNFFVLLSSTLVFIVSYKMLFVYMISMFNETFNSASNLNNFNNIIYVNKHGIKLLTNLGLILFIIFAFVLFLSALQTKFNIAVKAIRIDINKLNPINGIKRLFSTRIFFELVKSLIKILFIFFIIFQTIYNQNYKLIYIAGADIAEIISYFGYIIFDVMKKILLFVIIISIVDYIWQKRQHFQSIKMTKEEIKEELKQTEGDIKIKMKIKSLHKKRLKYKIQNMVKTASFVTVNPTHFAVAIKYQKGMKAPKVVAKGVDFIAEQIKKYAEKYKIPIIRNPELTRQIYYSTEVGKYIPTSLYKAVAKILVYIYKIEKEQNNGK